MSYDDQGQWHDEDDAPTRRRTSDTPPQSYAPHQPDYTRYQPQPPQMGRKHKIRNWALIIGGIMTAFIIIGATTSSKPTTTTASNPADAGPSGYPSPYSTDGINWATPTDDPATEDTSAAPTVPEQVTYHCTGHAPDGIDITYGPENSSYSASHLPFTKTMPLDDNAQYYTVTAQLSGAGSVTCTTTVQTSDGTQTVNKATAEGGYNIANAEVCSDFLGGWQTC